MLGVDLSEPSNGDRDVRGVWRSLSVLSVARLPQRETALGRRCCEWDREDPTLMANPERDLQDAAVDLLHRYHFLVFHQRPALTKDGKYISAVAYDGEGFPDLVATRPGAPVLFVEVKAASAVSKDQNDWLTSLSEGGGRHAMVLRPSSWKALEVLVKSLDAEHPLPEGWQDRLTQRAWRHTVKKGKDKIVLAIRKTGKMPATTSVRMIEGHPPLFKVGSKVYRYKGTGHDRSTCGYGPVVWDGTKSRWVPLGTAKFRCWPEDTKIITTWKGLPT